MPINYTSMLFDLHVHSHHSSCSRLHPQDILNHARDRGLDGVCITDHHNMTVRREVREGIQENGLCLILGMEYATPEGDFLLFGPFDDIPAGLAAGPLLKHVGDSGGAVVAAHPFRPGRQTDKSLIKKGKCRIVEGVNGRNTLSQNRRTGKWRSEYGVRLVGGSDAHCLEELGSVATRLTIPITTKEEFIEALRNGSFQEIRPDPFTGRRKINRDQEAPLRHRTGRPFPGPVLPGSGDTFPE